MFKLAILLGVFSYVIFFLGIFGSLNKNVILFVSLLFLFILIYQFRYFYKNISLLFKRERSKSFLFIFLLITLQSLVNLIGVLGPELSFDATWYHLTIPKLFLLNEKIFFIPGNLLYYSVMPKLVDILYIPALAFSGEMLAKLVHFLFGIATLGIIYKTTRRMFNPTLSLLAVGIFYSSLVIGWESISAMVDLGRSFFEILALYFFFEFVKSNKIIDLFKTSILIGLAICVKLLAIGSVGIYIALIIIVSLYKKTKLEEAVRNITLFILVAMLIPLPYFVFSFLNTGSPIYPFFTSILAIQNTQNLFNPLLFLDRVFNLFLFSADPISPIFFITILILPVTFNKFNFEGKLLSLYVLLSIAFCFILPDIGGGRFILPYLPGFSILSILTFKYISDKRIQVLMYAYVILALSISIFFRVGANAKYVPFILGQESKQEFLTKNLNFSFGNFYDVDNYFKKNIKSTDKVLLFGFHNLYYVNFPFIDSSWVKKGDLFNYIAVQNADIPLRFSDFKLVYENKTTHVKLYTDSKKKWQY